MTVSTNLMKIICSTEKEANVILARGLRVQVLPSIQALPRCQKHQFAAFIADEQMLVVWDDDPYHLIQRATDLEKQLLKMNWGSSQAEEEKEANASVLEFSSEISGEGGDLESAGDEARPTRFQAPVMVSCTIALLIAALGSGWRQLANEYKVDPKYGLPRLALILLTPLQMFLSLVRLFDNPVRVLNADRTSPVFLRCRYLWYPSDDWPDEPGQEQLKMLLGPETSSIAAGRRHLASYHHSVPGLQGRPGVCDPANDPVHQSRNLHLRDARGNSQSVRQ